MRVELIVTFDRIRVLAVLGGLQLPQVGNAEGVCARAAGDVASDREKVTEAANAVDRKVFDVERVRHAEFVGRQESRTDVADPAWPLGVAGTRVAARIGCVRLRRWRCRRPTSDAEVEVRATEQFTVNRVRGRAAVNDPSGDV